MTTIHKIALIGCGGVTTMHFTGYAAHPERVRVLAAFDPDAERLAAAQAAQGFEHACGDLDELLALDWTAAVIATPTSVRREVVERISAAGRHIFVEKPMADDYPEARRLVAACREAGVKLAVNQNFRSFYPFDYARQRIAAGDIGAPLVVSLQDLHYRQDRGWRIEQDRHALSVMAIHWFDGFRWLLNDEAVAVVCNRFSSPAVDCVGETDAVAQVSFGRGAACSLFQSFSAPLRWNETVIVGETGVLKLGYGRAELYRKDRIGDPVESWQDPLGETSKTEATFQGLNNLLSWVEGGPVAPNSGEDNLKTVALLDAAYRSADSGTQVLLQGGLP